MLMSSLDFDIHGRIWSIYFTLDALIRFLNKNAKTNTSGYKWLNFLKQISHANAFFLHAELVQV